LSKLRKESMWMKAWAVTKYKSELRQIDVPEPKISPTELLVSVRAVGINHLDEMMRQGEFKALLKVQMPLGLGHELAGEVIQVGSQVTEFKLGDRVYSRPSTSKSGTLSLKVAVDQSEVALIPSGLTFAEAAAVPLAGLTAWQALVDLGHVGPGSNVLIHGGAGAVGIIAIQLAKYLGARVTATAGKSDLEFVRTLGADEVFDYKADTFAGQASSFDFVLDNVGEKNVLASLPLVKKGGLVVGISGPADGVFAQSLGSNAVVKLVVKALSRKVTSAAKKLGIHYRFLFMKPNGAELSKLTTLFESGAIKPFVSKKYEFSEAATALDDLVNGRVRRGKAIVEMESR
jgi:NADPH:quinone reductase-like Zn-dependent oxidoreductase